MGRLDESDIILNSYVLNTIENIIKEIDQVREILVNMMFESIAIRSGFSDAWFFAKSVIRQQLGLMTSNGIYNFIYFAAFLIATSLSTSDIHKIAIASYEANTTIWMIYFMLTLVVHYDESRANPNVSKD